MPIFELTIRTLCDIRPEIVADAVFLFGQTQDNQASVFSVASQLLEQSRAHKILLIQTGAKSGYPGFDHYYEELRKIGLDDTQIVGIPLQTPTLNTLIEAQALVRYAKSKGFSSIYVSAAPFQQLRAFMTAVTVTLQEYPELNLYSQPGTALPWLESVAHSQGKEYGTRAAFINGEYDRIQTYQKKGDLTSIANVLDYLNRRDQD